MRSKAAISCRRISPATRRRYNYPSAGFGEGGAMLILVTGATGKVGRRFIDALRRSPDWKGAKIRALCHNRTLPEDERLSVVKGSIADRVVCEAAMRDVTHVVHLATCKETPEDVMDVTVRGLFWLLEAFREGKAARQFMLIGGDAAIGHF